MVDNDSFDHAGAMNAPTDTDPTPGPDAHDAGPRITRDEARDLRRLRRSSSDRKVAGVAGGIAQHLDIDPLLVRIAFVIFTFFGGGGLVLYGACWLIVPEDDTEEAVLNVDDGIRSAVLIIAGILAAASLVGDSVGGFGFPWPLLVAAAVGLLFVGARDARRPGRVPPPPYPSGPVPPGPSGTVPPGTAPPAPPSPAWQPRPRDRGPILFFFTLTLAAVLCGVVGTLDLAGWDVPLAAYPATVLATCGVMLLVGAVHGRAGGLILIGLLAAGATAVTTVTDDFSAGQVLRTPHVAADVENLDLGAGEMIVDLTEVTDLAELDGRTLRLDTRVGRIEVIVPDEDLTVQVDAEAQGVGEIRLFGDRTDNSDRATHDGGEGAPALRIDAEIFFGEIVVHTEEQAA